MADVLSKVTDRVKHLAVGATSKPVVVVFGATGKQGGSVVHALLKEGTITRTYAVRAVTRNPDKQAARSLADAGAEVVMADQLKDEDIRAAVQGAYAVFAVTNFWDPASRHKEVEVGTRIARAAKDAGVTHFVWSTLPNVEVESKGRWIVPHFTDKAKVDPVVRECAFQYHTFVQPGFYYQNFPTFGMAQQETDGSVTFRMGLEGGHVLDAYDPEADTGPAVVAALRDPATWHDQYIPLVGTHQPVKYYIEAFKKVTGKEARLETLSHDAMLKQDVELAHMFGWFREHTYYGRKVLHLDQGVKAAGSVTTWEQFLQRSGWTGGALS